jgi:aminoglycoside phosphotransferase (APT) family kinase protein
MHTTIEQFERSFGRVVDPVMLREACDEVTALGVLPRAFEQRDFSPWNILLSRNEELAVVDWESAEPDGLPVMDLWYGLAYLAFYRDGAMGSGRYEHAYRMLLDPSSPIGAITADCVSAYLAATKVPLASVRPLRLLTWMLHSRSEYRQMRRASRGSPTKEKLRESVFVRLWSEEMLHAS